MNDLIRMANDIARFHASYPEDEGVPMLAEHLNKFWAPSLRSRFHELMRDQPESFHPLVISCSPMVRCERSNPVRVEFADKHGTGG